ncbi:MAG: toprim domain-containing protein [Rhodospirillales bacterium]|nr:toprim domain-containing protein [Rhodospirillales bacterium]
MGGPAVSARAYRAAATVAQADRRARIDRVRSAVDLVEIVRRRTALKLKNGTHQGLCPFHREGTPSFHVYDDGHYHCFGCGAHGDLFKFVMTTERLSFREAMERLETEGKLAVAAGSTVARQRERVLRAELERRADMTLAAGRVWQQSVPLGPGDPAWLYLEGRGIEMARIAPALSPDVLRFHPGLSHKDFIGAHGQPLKKWPGLVARVVDAGERFLGVHRTYLDPPDGRGVVRRSDDIKRGCQKMSLGPVACGAIRLFPVPASGPLGLAEGIEDALSVTQLIGPPCWSCLDAGKLAAVRLPFEVGAVAIYADKDQPQVDEGREWAPEGIGLKRARQLKARLERDGVKVRIFVAAGECKDFNDELTARREREGEKSP